MTVFSPAQHALIDCILRTGRVTRPQIAELLPRLVRNTLQRGDAVCRQLTSTYGSDLATILTGFGAALLANDRHARDLFELIVSQTRPAH